MLICRKLGEPLWLCAKSFSGSQNFLFEKSVFVQEVFFSRKVKKTQRVLEASCDSIAGIS